MIKFFTASWCTACQMLKKNLSEEDLSRVTIIDADNQQAEIINSKVRSLPALVKYDEEGNELDRMYGSMTRGQFLQFVE